MQVIPWYDSVPFHVILVDVMWTGTKAIFAFRSELHFSHAVSCELVDIFFYFIVLTMNWLIGI